MLSTEFWLPREFVEQFQKALSEGLPGSHTHTRTLHIKPTEPFVLDKKQHPDHVVLEVMTPLVYSVDKVTNFLKEFSLRNGGQYSEHPRDMR